MSTPPFTGLAHDIRYATRFLWRQPGQSLAAVVTMALQQASMAAMAQANSAPQAVLALLQG